MDPVQLQREIALVLRQVEMARAQIQIAFDLCVDLARKSGIQIMDGAQAPAVPPLVQKTQPPKPDKA